MLFIFLLGKLEIHIRKLTDQNASLDRENKRLGAIEESYNILRSDLSDLRKKYKDDRQMMTLKIQVMNHTMYFYDSIC